MITKHVSLILLLFIVAVLLSGIVMATSGLTLTVKDKFVKNDLIIFSYTINTDSALPEPVWYSPGIYCPHNPISSPGIDIAVISANAPLQKTYTLGIVDDTFITEQCNAVLFIMDKETGSIQQRITKPFTIENIPSIPLEATLCSDATCTNMQSAAFIKGQKVYVGYVANPRMIFEDINNAFASQPVNAVISANITYNGNSTIVILPYSFIAELPGAYAVELIVDNNSNYLATKKEFSVIDAKAAVISDALVSQKQDRFLMNLRFLEDLRNGITPPKPLND